MTTFDQFENYATPTHGTVFAGHFNETDRYTISRPQGRNDWLITYTLEGEGFFQVPSGEQICMKGDVVLLRSSVPHRYGTVPGKRWNFMWAHFSGIYETHYLPEEELLLEAVGGTYLEARIASALSHVLVDAREQRFMWQELCENEIRGILLLIAERRNAKRDTRIEAVIHYMSHHMKEPIQIDELARVAGLSSSRLAHLFKDVTGMTMIQMLNEMRLKQAAMLLRHAGLTAAEAAYEAGFQNYHHFAALFKRQYGCSPRSYLEKDEK